MLKSQEIANEQSAPNVGQVRVTPDELTQALAAIETRKQAEASRLAGTIPLEDAVSELHLDSTPEEIWAEVQAQRVKATPPKPPMPESVEETRQEHNSPSQSLFSTAPQERRPKRRWLGLLTPLLLFWVFTQSGVLPHSWGHRTHIAAPILRPLAQIPDGKEVYADDSALVQISEGKSLAQITVSENATGNRWTLVKIGGHVYLRGYTLETASLQSLQSKPLNVYNDDDSGELEKEPTSEITLRVDKIPLQKSGGDDGYSEVTVPNFQPDPLTTLSPWH